MSGKNSNLVVHAGGVRRTRQQLAALPTPAATRTWKPIPHHELVMTILDGLAADGIEVAAEQYCTMGVGDNKVLGTMDLRMPDLDTDDFRMGLGLRASNDRTLAVQLVASTRVFVCDNWAFSGGSGAVFLRKKHTAALRLDLEVPYAIESFVEKAGVFRRDIDRMRDHALPAPRAKELIYDAFADKLVPARLFDDVHRLFFDDQEQRDKHPGSTLWTLNNAFTEALKTLTLGRQHGAGLAIGRYFGRVLDRGTRPAPGPIAVIDGIEVLPATLQADDLGPHAN